MNEGPFWWLILPTETDADGVCCRLLLKQGPFWWKFPMKFNLVTRMEKRGITLRHSLCPKATACFSIGWVMGIATENALKCGISNTKLYKTLSCEALRLIYSSECVFGPVFS